ncbi:MAG: FmdB family zinc ribbon protein [Planctomycetaceae bacterium]
MPTYDYICDACSHVWEEFQSITAEPTKKCPECKKKKARRRIGSGAGILFKGTGFYQTDYRSDSYKKAADADSKSSSGGESSSKGGSGGSSGGGSGGGSN